MFCPKCGNEMEDQAAFCTRCGEQLRAGNNAGQPGMGQPNQAQEPYQQQTPYRQQSLYQQQMSYQQQMPYQQMTPIPPRKKHNILLPVLLGAAAFIIVIAVAVTAAVFILRDNTDYIATVQEYKPFKSDGLSYTYGEVLEKYVKSAKWQEEDRSRESCYVILSGSLKGTKEEAEFKFKVELDGKKADQADIELKTVKIDGDKLDADEFSYMMFLAFDDGEKDLADVLYPPTDYDEIFSESDVEEEALFEEVPFEEEADEPDVLQENSGVTLEDYVASDEFQEELKLLKEQLEFSGMNMEIEAEGNTLNYICLMDDIVTNEELESAMESAMDQMAVSMEAVAAQLEDELGIDGIIVAVTYLDCNRDVIAYREFTAE